MLKIPVKVYIDKSALIKTLLRDDIHNLSDLICTDVPE